MHPYRFQMLHQTHHPEHCFAELENTESARTCATMRLQVLGAVALGAPRRWLQPSPHPHPFQRGVQLGFPESHRPADLEIGNQAGHAPAIEVAFADPEVGAGVFFGE